MLILPFPSLAVSVDIPGKDVIRKMDSLMCGKTTEGLCEMTIATPERRRRLEMRALEDIHP